MSADSWATCPRCLKRANDERARLEYRVESDYGKIPASEYLSLVAKAETPVTLDSTLREDYGIGVLDDGKFYAAYDGSCAVCGYSFSYSYDQMTKVDDLSPLTAKKKEKR